MKKIINTLKNIWFEIKHYIISSIILFIEVLTRKLLLLNGHERIAEYVSFILISWFGAYFWNNCLKNCVKIKISIKKEEN